MPVSIKELKICHYNANGLKKQINEITQFIIENRIDVMLVGETHLSKNTSINIPNYTIYRNDCNIRQGGTAVIIKNSIPHIEKITDIQSIQHTTVIIKSLNKNIAITAIYSPPKKSLNIKELEKLLRITNTSLVAGDYNAKHISWGNNTCTNQSGRAINNMTINDHNVSIYAPKDPTRNATIKQHGSTIDFAITRNWHYNTNTYVKHELSSDHFPVMIDTNIAHEKHQQQIKLIENHYNWKLFQKYCDEKIDHINWNWSLNELNIERNTDLVVKIITDGLECSCKLKNKTRKDIPVEQFPPELIAKIKLKNRKRKLFQITRYPLLKYQINQLNKEIKEDIKQIREARWTEILVEEMNFFRIPTAMIRKRKPIAPIIKDDNTYANSNKGKANQIAKALAAQFSPNKLDSRKEKIIEELNEKLTIKLNNDINTIEPITKNQITHYIKNQAKKTRKAPGPDGIQNFVFKHITEKTINTLVKLYNQIWASAYYPKSWKIADIVPVHKSGKPPNVASSYRPIALLNNIAKIFDSIVLEELDNDVNTKKILNNEQMGCRKNLSTVTQLTRLINNLSIDKDSKRSTAFISLDVEKAFDKVRHDILPLILHYQGINNHLIKIIKSYIDNRNFQVKINDERSQMKLIKSGVPQGSALGALLFILYINQTPKIQDNRVQLYQYVDDTAITATSKSTELAIKLAKNYTEKMVQHLQNIGLKLNLQKTQFMLFKKTIRNQIYKIKINDQELKSLDSTKYLGMTIDKNLSFNKHINNAISNAKFRMYTLKSVLKNPLQSTRRKTHIYKAYIKPVLTYGYPAWISVCKGRLKALQIVQNKNLRLIQDVRPYERNNEDIHAHDATQTITNVLKNQAEKFIKKIQTSENPLVKDILHIRYKSKKKRQTTQQLLAQ